MTVLNTADDVRIGANQASAVYIGSTLAWSPVVDYDPLSAIAWHSAAWAEGPAFQALGLADGATVTTFPDETGNGRNWTQSNSALRPTYRAAKSTYNNRPALEFFAQSMAQAAYTALPQPNTIVVVGGWSVSESRYLFDGIGGSNRHAVFVQSLVERYMFAGSSTIRNGSNDNDQHLFICEFDGASSEFNISDITTTGNPGAHSLIGLRIGGDSGNSSASRFKGDIAFVGIYPGVLTDDQKADLLAWSLSHYGTMDRRDVFAGTFQPRQHATLNPIVVRDTTPGAWTASQVREPGNVIHDVADADASRRYKFYFSGKDASNNVDVGVAFSPDGVTWTQYGSNPIVSLAEDPYVALNTDGTLHRDGSGLMHMFTEEKFAASSPEQNGINHYTSTDGVTWTADAANPVFEPSDAGAGAWEADDCTSPVVWWDGTASKFYMLYEGRAPSQAGEVGVAWSTDGTTWTRSPSNPIIAPTSGFGVTSVVPDDILFTSGRAVLLGHAMTTSTYQLSRWSTTEPNPELWTSANWSQYQANPVTAIDSTTTLMSVSGPNHNRRWIWQTEVAPETMVQSEA